VGFIFPIRIVVFAGTTRANQPFPSSAEKSLARAKNRVGNLLRDTPWEAPFGVDWKYDAQDIRHDALIAALSPAPLAGIAVQRRY
jgi:hypothetical protein